MLEIPILFLVFSVGAFAGYLIRVFLVKHTGYAGQILITETEEKKIFSLELNGDPEDLVNQKEVIFKVNTHPLVRDNASQ